MSARAGWGRPDNQIDAEPTHWWTASNRRACAEPGDILGSGCSRSGEFPPMAMVCAPCLVRLAAVVVEAQEMLGYAAVTVS